MNTSYFCRHLSERQRKNPALLIEDGNSTMIYANCFAYKQRVRAIRLFVREFPNIELAVHKSLTKPEMRVVAELKSGAKILEFQDGMLNCTLLKQLLEKATPILNSKRYSSACEMLLTIPTKQEFERSLSV